MRLTACYLVLTGLQFSSEYQELFGNDQGGAYASAILVGDRFSDFSQNILVSAAIAIKSDPPSLELIITIS